MGLNFFALSIIWYDKKNYCRNNFATIFLFQRYLDLTKTAVTDTLAQVLASFPFLESLLLTYTNVTSMFIPALDQLPLLASLKLTGCRNIDDQGILLLSESRVLSMSLRNLALGHRGISDQALARISQLQQLEALRLWNTSVSPAAAEAIATQTGLRRQEQMATGPGTYLFSRSGL